MIASTGIAGIVGLAMGWIIVIAFIVATVIMLTGRGSALVTGFNTLSKQEQEAQDKTKVSKRAGLVMLLVDIILIAYMAILQFVTSENVVVFSTIVFCICVIVVPILAAIGGLRYKKER